ncbi:HigA family addiction module antitoxin [Mesorhizobium sp. M0659]|uniref:HigA family addiction module antitoxin n=1 Tax=Mesorhizobium sp. M0659 TaxID=2956980 RepID=UPI00333D46B8
MASNVGIHLNNSRFRTAAEALRPGRVLRDKILAGSNITQEQLADAMGVSRYSVNQIVNGRRSITAEMAIRLSAVTSTSPQFWLNLQMELDLCQARAELGDTTSKLKVLRRPLDEASLFVDEEPEGKGSDAVWRLDR